jgi:hypothetical protein
VSGEAPAYAAQSPHWGMAAIEHKGRKAFRPLELNSIGLTNNPNIPGTQIGLNEADEAGTNPNERTMIKTPRGARQDRAR